MLTTKVYWESLVALVATMYDFWDGDYPFESWNVLFDNYGEDAAAARLRLDVKLIDYNYTSEFYGVSRVEAFELASLMPDAKSCEAYQNECQIRLSNLAPAVSLSDLTLDRTN